MNTDRLAKIAEWLEAGGYDGVRDFDVRAGLGFGSMDPFWPERHLDKTDHVCDIAGAAVSMFGDIVGVCRTCSGQHGDVWAADDDAVFGAGADALELGDDTATALFYPARANGYDDYNDATWAARVIRKLIATGRVDWPGCKPDPLVIMRNARTQCGKQAPRTHRYQIARLRGMRKITCLRMNEEMVRMVSRSNAMVAQAHATVAAIRAAFSDER